MPSTATTTLLRFVGAPADRRALVPTAVRLVRWAGAATGLVAAGVAAELLWTVHRPLPSFAGLDASGTVPGRDPSSFVRMVVLGDSASTGPGLDRADHVWFRQALARLDLDRTVEVTSLAVGGSRVADVRTRVDEALALTPDMAIVAVGSNDAIHGTQVRRFAEHLDELLRRLEREVPVVAVCNIGDLGNVARVPPPLKAGLRARGRSISRAIERVVGNHDRAVLLDMTTSNEAFRDRSVFAPDLFHPSQAGHAAWAAAAIPGLQVAFDRLWAGDERPQTEASMRAAQLDRGRLSAT